MRLTPYITTTMRTLEDSITHFLQSLPPLDKPILLGFSGGEDSLALAHCLQKLKVPFHLAHFDHGWREKSRDEAIQLHQFAEEQKIPFHTSRSSTCQIDELLAREERYLFFAQLFTRYSFQALMLAHHRDDQIETVLKRVLEGANLPSLKGMRGISYRGSIPIWRPLIGVSKEEIRAYCLHHHLNPIEDQTNQDTQFLRARMRKKLIPHLSDHFGKEIHPSLIRLGKYGAELEDYLQRQTEKYLSRQSRGPFGLMCDFSPFYPLEKIEIRYVLSGIFKEKGVALSEPVVDQIFALLQANAANRKVEFGGEKIIIDRKHLFWLEKSLPRFPKQVALVSPKEVVENKGEGWEWTIHLIEGERGEKPDWRDWWQGKISMALPPGEYELLPPTIGAFRKLWNTSKVPAFLRSTLPIIREKRRGISYEFLTGRGAGRPQDHPPLWNRIILEIKEENMVT